MRGRCTSIARNKEAQKQINAALAMGTRDAKFFRHAGEIALALGDPGIAKHYLEQSAELNSVDSQQARVTLAGIL
jgi:hypothetical protein